MRVIDASNKEPQRAVQGCVCKALCAAEEEKCAVEREISRARPRGGSRERGARKTINGSGTTDNPNGGLGLGLDGRCK